MSANWSTMDGMNVSRRQFLAATAAAGAVGASVAVPRAEAE